MKLSNSNLWTKTEHLCRKLWKRAKQSSVKTRLFTFALFVFLVFLFASIRVLFKGEVLPIAENSFTIPGSGELQANFDDTGYDDGSGTTYAISTEVRLDRADDWWDVDWSYKKQVTLKNQSSDSLAADTTVQITVNTKGLYDAGKLQADCDDLRVAYSAAGTEHSELPREYQIASGSTNCSDSQSTIITFPLKVSIASAGSSSNYYLYYDNGSATTPVYPTETAISFEDTYNLVTISDADHLDGFSAFTMEFWAFTDTASVYGRVLEKRPHPAKDGYHIILGGIDTSAKYRGEFGWQEGGTNLIAADNAYFDGRWHHVAIRYDGSNLSLFVDGEKDATDVVVGSKTLLANDNNLYIGKNDLGANPIVGKLDEVRIWNISRTDTQIKRDMNVSLTGKESGLVGYWRMDEGSGATITDYSKYSQNGTLTSTDKWLTNQNFKAYSVGAGGTKDATLVCPFNGSTTCADGETPTTETGAIRYSGGKSALSFDGINDYVNLGSSSDLLTSKPFTYEAWIKTTYKGSHQMIFTPHNNIRELYILPTSGYLWLALAGDVSFGGQTDVADGDWHHVAAVYTSSKAYLFVDGTLDNSVDENGTVGNPSGPLYIGMRGGSSYPFRGEIDEARMSDVARYTSSFTSQTVPFVPDGNTLLLLHFDENGDDPRNTGKVIDAGSNGNHGTISGADYVGGLVGVDASATDTGKVPLQSYAAHHGVFIEEGTTNKITNPSFEHSTYDTNWSVSSPLTNNLMAYWKLEEASGTRADSHGSNNLTDNNTVGQAGGKLGNAAQFVRANSEYLSIVDNADLSTGDVDYTMAAWVYLDSKPGNYGLIRKWGSTEVNEYLLLYSSGSDRFMFWVHGTGDANVTANSLGSPALDTWYYIIAWHDSTANTINIQVNNGAVDSAAEPAGGGNDADAPFTLGEHNIPNYLDGRMDSVGFWKRVLTSEERTVLYNSGNGIEHSFSSASENTTAPYYKFGSKSAKIVADGDGSFLTSINPGNTNTHTLSAYVYNGTSGSAGGTVDSSVAELVFGGSVQTTTYTDIGGGWWKLKYSGTPPGGSSNFGVRVKAGKTVYVDGVQLEEKGYATTYTDGTFGTGYSWTGTAHNSTSTRTKADLYYPATTTNISATTGTISVWLKPDWQGNDGLLHELVAVDCSSGSLRLYKDTDNNLKLTDGTNTASKAVSWSKDQWQHIVGDWGSSNLHVYVNNSAGTASGAFSAPTINTSGYINIGENTSEAYQLKGVISDLRIFDNILTSDEVTDLYYQGLVTHENGSEEIDKYLSTGTYTTPILNLGAVADWSAGDDFASTVTLNGGTLSFQTQTSANGTDWTSLEDLVGAEIQSTPQKYLKVKGSFTSNGSQDQSPVLSGLTINYIPDNTPPTNPTTLTESPGTSGNWFNDPTPTFKWPRAEQAGGATDPGEGASGVKGYHTYFGTDDTAIPYSTVDNKVFIDDPESGDTEFTLSEALTTIDTYYLRIQAEDNAGNYPGSDPEDVWEAFIYKFDNVDPVRPLYISVNPSGYTKVNSYTFTWPAGSDTDAGVWGYCYKAGSGSETCEAKEVLESGSNYEKQLDDIAYQAGENIFYVRTKDNAGNYSDYIQTTFYYNPDAPSAPINVQATQTTGCSGGGDNCWIFSWDEPVDYTESIIRYYYSVNETPTIESSTVEGTSTAAFSAGTRQGQNTFYVVAEDVIGVNFGVYGSVNFNVTTAAPGIPMGLLITDSSNRDKEDWSLTVQWSEPLSVGSGLDHYNVFRSEDGSNYTKIAETSASGYLDTDLSNAQTYYYKVTAEDNAGAESGLSTAVSDIPTGRYTSPPVFGGVPVATTTAHTVTIQWTTDRMSDSYVEYGYTDQYELGRVGDSVLTTNHKVIIRGLKAETLFHFRTQSLDEGSERDYPAEEGYSEDYTFSTLKAPDITEVVVSDITLNSAIVSWKTTTISTSEVHYGKTLDYGSMVSEASSSLTTNHTIRLSGLASGSVYHFKIIGRDADDVEIYSQDNVFQTVPYPTIRSIRLEQGEEEGEVGMRISWETNVGASSIVKYYPKEDESNSLEVFKADLATEHEVFLTGLMDATTYRVEVSGRDKYGNLAQGETQEFTTDLDTKPPVIKNLTVETASQGVGRDAKSQIIVSWETNEVSTSQVEYGLGVGGEDYSSKTPEDTSLVKTHVVIISDLEPSTPYHVRAVSNDAAGNGGYSYDNVVVTRMPSESALDLIISTFRKNFGWLFGGFE